MASLVWRMLFLDWGSLSMDAGVQLDRVRRKRGYVVTLGQASMNG